MDDLVELLQRLQALDLPAVLPGELPEGFGPVELWTESDEFGKSYRLSYYGPEEALLCVEATDAGVGDVFGGDQRFEVENPELGKSWLEFYHDSEPIEMRSSWWTVGSACVSISGRGVELDQARDFLVSLSVQTSPED